MAMEGVYLSGNVRTRNVKEENAQADMKERGRRLMAMVHAIALEEDRRREEGAKLVMLFDILNSK